MKSKAWLMMLLFAILLASLAFSQTAWQKYDGNPVLVPTQSWESSFGVFGPRVLKIGNQYKMWYTGVEFRRLIGLATSDDGIHWTKFNGNPVLRNGNPGSFDSEHVQYGTVLFINNQYWMWYSGHNGQAWQIGLATSPDGIQWTKHPNNPVLTIGNSGEWDSYGLQTNTVLFDGQVFKIWYNGNGPQYEQAAGYAESSDGIHWQKHPNNPVLTPVPGPWEANAVSITAVLYVDGAYQAWYVGNIGGTTSSLGLATSKDGINWQRYADNPLLTPGANGAWDSITLGGCWVMLENDTYKMWYSGRGDDVWKIGYAVSALTPPTEVQGRIVVSHDVNTLSSQYGGPQEQQFAVNVAKFLIGKNSGNILAIESNPIDLKRNYAPAVKDALTSAGYNITYSSASGYTLTELMAYDAVFVGIIWPPPYTVIDNTVLTDYVNSGGNVYICSGSGSEPDSSREASLLNPFLKNFGLMFDSTGYNHIDNRTITITSHHPIFDGVTALHADNGQSIIDLGTESRAQIVQLEENQGVYAVFDPAIERVVFLPRVYGLPGDTIQVTLYADPLSGINGGDFVMCFDPEVLTAMKVETTDFTKNFLVAANLDTPGVTRISLASAQAAAGGLGGLFTLHMVVNPSLQIPDTTFSRTLKLREADLYDQNGQPLPAKKSDGLFILGKPTGDVNGDGFVNAADAILTLRIAAGLLHPTPRQFAEADVDRNGLVESFDASIILRRSVGLPDLPSSNTHVVAHLAFSPFSADAGNEVETQLVLSGIDKVLSGDVTVRFEAAALEITEIQPSPQLSGAAFVSNLENNGRAQISFAAANGVQAKTIAVLHLRAKVLINEKNLHATEGTFFDNQGRRCGSVVTGIGEAPSANLPSEFRLEQNYPNPFQSRSSSAALAQNINTTQIRYMLPQRTHVKLVIYDLQGRQIRLLEEVDKAAGEHVQTWDGLDAHNRRVASGVYVYRLHIGENVFSKKMLLLN